MSEATAIREGRKLIQEMIICLGTKMNDVIKLELRWEMLSVDVAEVYPFLTITFKGGEQLHGKDAVRCKDGDTAGQGV